MKISSWQFYLGFYQGRFFRLILSILLSSGQSLILLPIAFMVRYIFDVTIPWGELHNLILLGLVILVLSILNEAATLYPRYLSLNTTKLVLRDIREELVSRCYLVARSHFHSADLAKLHSVIVQDTQRLDSMSNAIVALFLPAMINIFALSCVLLYLSPRLFSIIIVIVPILYLINHFLLKKRLIEKTQASHRAFERFSKGILFVLQMMELTRIQTAEEMETNRQKIYLEEVRETGEANSMSFAIYTSVQNMITIIPMVLILIVGGLAVIEKTMTFGALLSFYVAIALLKGYVQTLLSSLPYIIEGNESLITLEKNFRVKDKTPFKGRKKISFKGKITFRSVSFHYQKEREVLHNVDLVIQPGNLAATMGPNGVGKTTLAYLILGFYRPQKGCLFADGFSYDTLDINHLRKQIGVVPQDPVIFSGTILENITYGQPNVNLKEVERAAQLASAHKFIEQLPQGYETQTGEQGVLLSGGQCQRIAIARALLRRPKLLILDEPTNHLDNDTVKQLLENIRNLAEEPSILLITHIDEVARQADSIYVLNRKGTMSARKSPIIHLPDQESKVS